ncbi:MAG: alpha/beta fold hydrolase [Gammaproteobacteria bacterium]|nr:alpha/beta fold hydrolase [Gammaproteobacteria bacterium]
MPEVTDHGCGSVSVVLLHGWGLGAQIWEPVLPYLVRRFRVHVVTLPGHGGAPPWPAQTDLGEQAGLLLEQLPAGAIWLGWSLGAMVAIAAAAARPQAVAGLGVMAANARFVAAPEWPDGVEPAVFESFARLLHDAPEAARRRFAALLAPAAGERRALAAALAVEPAWADRVHCLARPLDILAGADLRAQLPRIRCPVCWLLAEQDPLVPPSVASALGRVRPQWEVRRVPGGHAFFVTRPTTVADTLERLLKHHGD